MKRHLLLIFLAISLSSQAQKGNTVNYKKYPVWIQLMNDSNANYFETIKAYETFWKGKRKPLEEDELIGQESGGGTNAKKESRHEIKERKAEKELYRKYGLACKKFEHWKIWVRPYVQENGHILTQNERLRLWKEQQVK